MSSKNLREGDLVKIILNNGYQAEGNVLSANWYDDGGYYVELKGPKGYHYWKEIDEPGIIYRDEIGKWEQLDPEGSYRDDLSMEDLRSRYMDKVRNNMNRAY